MAGGDDPMAPGAAEGDAEFVVGPEEMRALLAGGNPALLEAVQRGLARMVGSSSGYIESLPAVVRTRISYLEELQVEFEDLEDKFDDELKELEAKYRALYAPLLEKRRGVVVGEVEAPENEVNVVKEVDADKEEVGIPDFWSIALSNHPGLEERITDKDKEVLAYVTDVTKEDLFDDEEEEVGFKIAFHLRENPFLTNTELTMAFYMTEEGGYLQVRDIESCDLHWKTDKDVTVKKMKKKPKPGSKGKGPQTKLEPVESFFRWFTDCPEVPDNLMGDGAEDEDEEDEELEELRDRVEDQMRVGEILREDLIPNAVKWYTGEALLEMQDDEDEDDEFDSEDEDDDGEGDEDGDDVDDDDDEEDDGDDDSADEGGPGAAVPKDAKEQPAECKQQ